MVRVRFRVRVRPAGELLRQRRLVLSLLLFIVYTMDLFPNIFITKYAYS